MNIKSTLSAIRTKMTFAQLAIIGMVGAASILFLELSEDVWLKEGFTWDAPIMLWLHQWRTPWLDNLFLIITQSAGPWIVAGLILVGIALWQREERKTAVFLLASFAGSAALNALLKLLFSRPRPNVFSPIAVETSFSFPSGHTMTGFNPACRDFCFSTLRRKVEMKSPIVEVSIPLAGIFVFLRLIAIKVGVAIIIGFQSRLPGFLFFYGCSSDATQMRLWCFNPACRDFCFSTCRNR